MKIILSTILTLLDFVAFIYGANLMYNSTYCVFGLIICIVTIILCLESNCFTKFFK
jgi:hypothetical protein